MILIDEGMVTMAGDTIVIITTMGTGMVIIITIIMIVTTMVGIIEVLRILRMGLVVKEEEYTQVLVRRVVLPRI